MGRIGSRIAGTGRVCAAVFGSGMILLGAVPGCEADLPASFDSPDAGSRLRAVVSSVENPDRDDLRGMVAALGSDDPALRSLAIAALERTAGERFGYDAWATEVDRRRAIDRWDVWLAQQAEASPKATPTP